MVVEGTMTFAYSGCSEAVTAYEPRLEVIQLLRLATPTPASAHRATLTVLPSPRPRTPKMMRGRNPERTRGM